MVIIKGKVQEMKEIAKEELQEIIRLHSLWLCGDSKGIRADLSDANLSDANLNNAHLSNANLRGADLSYANLSNANLNNAHLSNANLNNAHLSNANLNNAHLSNANLNNAHLRGANLNNAHLRGANLKGADLSYANYGAMQCPEEGNFIAFKKANNKIVKLQVLEDSKRSSTTSRKCRCDKALVLSIESVDKKVTFNEVSSSRDSDFIYEVGKIVSVDNFNEDRWEECTTGIHFFITRQEAVEYK